MSHNISMSDSGAAWCTCGKQFPTTLAALDHALPLNTLALADAVRADPASTPEQIERADQVAWEADRIASRVGDDRG